ncbi:PucR family transcriptional regulator [Lentzea sp. JNUCC 0626]|uniref:PucR family transcriptional regulator n=1 Tax=Lentzea sp. JNUCC 0626 TaxID=3367513 RepID=UPI0037481BF6
MTLLDDRIERIAIRSELPVVGATEFVEQLLAVVEPEPAVPVASALLDQAACFYGRVLDGKKGVSPSQRAQIRSAGKAFVAAGGCLDVMTSLLSRLASHVMGLMTSRRFDRMGDLLDLAHVLMHEVVAGATELRGSNESSRQLHGRLVERLLLHSEIAPEMAEFLKSEYVVASIRLPRSIPLDWLVAVVEKGRLDGFLCASLDDEAVILVPERSKKNLARLCAEVELRFGVKPWIAVAEPRLFGAVASGYKEVKGVMALVLATGRAPGGFYRLDEFLIEHAVVSDPIVSSRLLSVISPLVDNETLIETLDVLIRNDFSRSDAARDLFVHRSTLDYRIRRIEEITGYSPSTGRGSHVLCMARTVYSISKHTR